MQYLKNFVKEKTRKNQMTVGSWLNLPSLEVTEIMAKSGFDFLVVDQEHGTMTFETIQKMAMVMEGHGVLPYVRVQENDPAIIKKALDLGAYGIIVPMINTKEQAQAAVDSLFYRPVGKRGVGLSRAQGYGLDFKKYQEWYRENLSLIVQIEDVEAIDHLEEILSIDEIDATMIGPYDISSSVGFPGEFDRPEVKKLFDDYERISIAHKKPFGYHIVQSDKKALEEKKDKGYRFIVWGVDELLMSQACINEKNLIQSVLE